MKSSWHLLSTISANFKVFVNIFLERFRAGRILPVVLNEVLKIIVSVNCCAHIPIVVFKFFIWYLTSDFELIKLSGKFLKNFCSVHLSSHKFRMSLNVIISSQLIKSYWSFSWRNCFKSKLNLSSSVLIQLSS